MLKKIFLGALIFLFAIAIVLWFRGGYFLRLGDEVPRGPAPSAGRGESGTALKFITAYPNPNFSDAVMASNYDLVILQNWPVDENPERVRDLKKLNPRLKVLFYRNGHGTWPWQENYKEIDAHESWFLHGASGARLEDRGNSDGDYYYVMDLSNPEYRAYQINYIMGYVSRAGFDGLFADGPPADLALVNPAPKPPRAVFDRWHRDYVLPWVREMKQALGDKIFITNSTVNYNTRLPFADDADYFSAGADGTMIEGFGHAPWQKENQVPGGAWAWQMEKYKRNIEAGKYTLVLSGILTNGLTEVQVKRWETFTLASYLMYASGEGEYYNWRSQDTLPSPEQNLELGAPLGDPDILGGVWKRDFENGRVYVNPNSDARFWDDLTLAPWTGSIIQDP